MSKRISLVTLALVSAFKRKDIKEVGALILDAEGKTDEAKELRDASRFTVALIDRTFVATDVDEPEEVEQDEPTEEVEQDEPIHGSHEEHKAIVKAIKKGKGKKALKLIKQAREGGARGSVLKDLEKQAKDL